MWNLNQVYDFREGKVAYDVMGVGPPIVLVHGTPSSSFIWRHLIETLSKDWTVYVYDLIGYGLSEKKDGQDVSLEIQTDLLQELLAHWNLESPTIVGHDFGGAITLRTHLLKEQRFDQMVLMDPVALSPWGTEFARLVMQYIEVFQQIPSLMYEAMLGAYIQSAFFTEIEPELLSVYMEPWLGEQGQKAFFRQISYFDERYTNEVSSLYSEISIPVCILWGEEDTWIPKEKGKELHNLIKGSEYHLIKEAGHFLQEDNPIEIIERLERFLMK